MEFHHAAASADPPAQAFPCRKDAGGALFSLKRCPFCMARLGEGSICPACGRDAASCQPSSRHLPVGTMLENRYLIGSAIGEGGFGITYIGLDLRMDLRVAVKEYYPIGHASRIGRMTTQLACFSGESAAFYARGKMSFLKEARVMASMASLRVIVDVLDCFEENNTAYLVMEYVQGDTFRDMVKEHGPIPPEELFPLLEPLFPTLSAMHENGMIHRDLSPDNLMWDATGVRLLDFGCAREADMGKKTLTVAFHHGYAPVEQYQQKGQGPWTDVYGLCATIYYCLTGIDPPHALDRIVNDSLLVPSKLGVHLKPEQEKAILKGLKLQPHRRFQTIEELRSAIYETADA